MSLSIRFSELSKQFGETIALWRVSEQLHPGDRVSILGHNGAGKSTLLHILATLSRPSSGDISFSLDGETCDNPKKLRNHLTFLSHEPMLYPDLTAMENLRFINRLYQRNLSDAQLGELLERVGMADFAERLFRTCSRGMQQRLSLARALLPQPKLLLLDEPFSGLDRGGVERMKHLFSNTEMSWILVTHHLRLGYELANRFWILHRGRMLHSLHKRDLSYEAYLRFCEGSSMEEGA
ncbi:ATP-binding cassette domain-containing protein [Acanthopleuribacter pedis]|uniref:ABC transporter ATP-binding protein n=1 Tax=Acanthopleuribacter pedis TaxID=442870 RepID=A0A8J7U6P3_9BACT|nr:ABC transporter ATP-binding protein [Acanthopleuribacter pedis]